MPILRNNEKYRHELFIIYNFCFLGTYKSTENETVVDIGFDINGTKHLDASFGYAIKRFHYGYTFAPQMHLIVNNELIAALQGFFYLSIYIYIFPCHFLHQFGKIEKRTRFSMIGCLSKVRSETLRKITFPNATWI